jgi:putative transposase
MCCGNGNGGDRRLCVFFEYLIFHIQQMKVKETRLPANDRCGVLELYGQAVPESFFEQLEKELGRPARLRIFNLPLLVWLMISQRLDPKATLSTAVQQVVQQQPQALLSDHKRIRDATVSCHTGAYSDARQEMPLVVAEKVADRVLEHLLQGHREALPGWDRRVFILDGTSLEMPHTAELVREYPPHPKSHWPVLLLLMAQELTTGLAERPCWGPMYGKQATSEQALTERLLDRLPSHSVLLGDINFGVFSVAFASVQRGHDVVLRLQPNRAGVVGRGLPLQPGLDQEVCWRPSAYERKRHPGLPAEACVRGRLIVQQVQASDGSSVILYLFTTLQLPVEQIVQLYGLRWNVETDLRSLKRTLDLQTLRCKSPKMIAKELILAIVGYNLVRAMMNLAAEEHKLDPRRLSFSRSQDVVDAALPGLAAATPAQYPIRFRRMLQLIASCKLPDRSGRPSTPREVWGHGCKFARRKGAALMKD